MNELAQSLSRFLSRFRYPVSLPEDIASDLGISIPNTIPFEAFLERLANPTSLPKNIWRHMNRYLAENRFKRAVKKEVFRNSSFFSYYFSKGWVVIALYFDENDLLRRLYVQCPHSQLQAGFDIELESPNVPLSSLHPLSHGTLT